MPPPDAVLEAHLPEAELAEVRRLLYGKVPASLPISDAARKLADERQYDIKYVAAPSTLGLDSLLLRVACRVQLSPFPRRRLNTTHTHTHTHTTQGV